MSHNLARKPEQPATLTELAERIQSHADFVAFAHALAKDFQEKPLAWENGDLGSFLQALAAWTEDMYGYYKDTGATLPMQPSWKILAEILLAARVYE